MALAQPGQEKLLTDERVKDPAGLAQLSPLAGQLLNQQAATLPTDRSPVAAQMLETARQAQADRPVYMPFAPGTPTAAERARRAADEAQRMHEKYLADEAMVAARSLKSPYEKAADPFTPTKDVYANESYDPGVITAAKQIGDFNTSEFACKGTGKIKVSSELIRRLQALRDYLGVPIIVTSGYRSPEHNRAVRGAPNSRHLTGEAADIVAPGVSLQELAKAAEKFFGDGGIGSSYGGHVHVDVRSSAARW